MAPWGPVRASSNTPNLVVVCVSQESAEKSRAIVAAMAEILAAELAVAALTWAG